MVKKKNRRDKQENAGLAIGREGIRVEEKEETNEVWELGRAECLTAWYNVWVMVLYLYTKIEAENSKWALETWKKQCCRK